jgi:hypothetical protein
MRTKISCGLLFPAKDFLRALEILRNDAVALEHLLLPFNMDCAIPPSERLPDYRVDEGARCRRKTMRRVTGSNSPTSDVSASAARRRELRKNAFDDRREFVQVIGLADNL